ncbi:visual pigment-like receptor peropsin [Paramacrobiotus metropolitanus]|uniref:visual pigment-like receptor peropsin n=1 Tax=Paramacrobiotus metropolitanus TaxID=2943436 RepID=UPI00244583B3|nr:visual pigment-like receptor peropsin [Paramacrobiotus metropolitanus]
MMDGKMTNLSGYLNASAYYLNETAMLGTTNASNTTGDKLTTSWLMGTSTTTLLTNCGVLLLFLRDKSLRTPFNVYIIALLATNVVYTGTTATLKILQYSHGAWWMGIPACTMNLYFVYIFGSYAVHLHLLITLNRTWALFWPVSYRNRHSTTMAVCLCVGMFLYLNALVVPGLVIDALHYRVPVEIGCWVNLKQQFTWATFVNFWVYDAPKVYIAVCYPFLLHRQLRRRRMAAVARKAGTTAGSSQPPGTSIQPLSSNQVVPSNQPQQPANNAPPTARPTAGSSRSFVVLTLFTVSVVVCWLPSTVYYDLTRYISPEKMATFLRLPA